MFKYTSTLGKEIRLDSRQRQFLSSHYAQGHDTVIHIKAFKINPFQSRWQKKHRLKSKFPQFYSKKKGF